MDMSLPQRQRPPLAPAVGAHSEPWRPGDRILAPWEPMFLYAGRIVELRAGQASIRFDGGDLAWIDVDQLDACEFTIGEPVDARRSIGMHYYPGELSARNGDDVRVRFEDGIEEWTTLSMLRLARNAAPASPAGPSGRAGPVPGMIRQGTFSNAEEGDRVWAPWQPDRLYVGVVDQIESMEAHIHFGNGNRGWVQLDQLAAYAIPVGLRIQGRWLRGSIYFPGTIDQVDGERIHIRYDDGDREWTTPDVLAYPCPPFGPPARATKRAFRFPWTWLIWGAFIAGFIGLRSCR
ncbi:MAG TPA: hypothetical protein VHR72_11495 [Gemmataceae bacterium]|nr:hypothetical protein [Gemmataceae bacterium]